VEVLGLELLDVGAEQVECTPLRTPDAQGQELQLKVQVWGPEWVSVLLERVVVMIELAVEWNHVEEVEFWAEWWKGLGWGVEWNVEEVEWVEWWMGLGWAGEWNMEEVEFWVEWWKGLRWTGE
jgi:hypothetical protein